MKSPVYIDCRKIIFRMRAAMMDHGATVITHDIGHESLDALAGGETAGIPLQHGSLSAPRCQCNMCAKSQRVWA